MNLTLDPALLLLQAVPFLVTMIALHYILFKPMLAYLEEREAAIEGVRREAVAMQERVSTEQAEWEKRLTEARREAGAYRSRLHDEAAAQRNEILARARVESEQLVGAALAELKVAREEARGTLRDSARQLAQEVAVRVLDRPSAQA